MPEYSLKLYVSGRNPRSERAIREARRLCSQLFRGECELSVVDVKSEPAAAAADQILATPALVRSYPGPARRVVGDLSDLEKVQTGLGLAVRTASPARSLRQ